MAANAPPGCQPGRRFGESEVRHVRRLFWTVEKRDRAAGWRRPWGDGHKATLERALDCTRRGDFCPGRKRLATMWGRNVHVRTVGNHLRRFEEEGLCICA